MARILMVSSEAAPFAKTGGLADVLGALPKALVHAGEEAAVVLPLYRRANVPNPQPVYDRLRFSVGNHGYSANILERSEGGVHYYFVQIPELYDREAFYDEGGREYPDNHLRFAALCYAALGVARYLFMPDIVHCHDWQAGLVPVLLRDIYRNHPAFLGIKTVFTIHNLGYQGLFRASALADIGLPARLFRPDLLEFYGNISFLKAGLAYSDMLTTVSPRYAQEIQTPELGVALDGLLRARASSLVGILNGADYDEWDPLTDRHIARNYDRSNIEGKQGCKKALLAESHFPEDRINRPLIGIVSRFTEQKGFDLLMRVREEVAREDLSWVVLGSGDQKEVEAFFVSFASAYPDRVAVKIGYDNALAHRIEAGADMFLMPSRYEPCGLNQMYSMRYGTLPIVHATGGLDNTVDQDTGFKYPANDSYQLLGCVRDALQVYGTPRWASMMDTAMQRDFSWAVSAAEYVRLYRRL